MSSVAPPSSTGVDDRSGAPNSSAIDGTLQTVEIIKQPGQTLGFYIREGNGIDRWTGVFISRIAPGSVVAANGVLRIGDEILAVNGVDVTRTRLDDVVVLMSIPKRLVLDIRVPRPACGDINCSNAACSAAARSSAISGAGGNGGYDDGAPPAQPVVVLKSGFASAGNNGGLQYNGGGDDRSPDEPIGSPFYPQQQQQPSSAGSRCGTLSKRYDGRSGLTQTVPATMTTTGLIYPADGPASLDAAYHQQQQQQQAEYERARYGPGSAGGYPYPSGGVPDPYGTATKSGPPTFSRSYSTGGARSSANYGGPASSAVPVHDYASDTDVGGYNRVGGGSGGRMPVGRQLARPYGAVSSSMTGSPASAAAIRAAVAVSGPDRVYYNGFDDPPPPPAAISQTVPGSRAGLTNGGGRSASFDQYNSDSEVVLGSSGGGWYPGFHRSSSAAMRAMSGSVMSAGGGGRCGTIDGSVGVGGQGGCCPPVGANVDERSYSLPHVYHGYCSSGDECDSTWNGGKFENLSLQATSGGNGVTHRTRSNTTGDYSAYGDIEDFRLLSFAA
jgi:hypothetical protein